MRTNDLQARIEGYILAHKQEQASSPVVDKIQMSVKRTIEKSTEKRSSHPGSTKDVPFLDLEVFSKTFNVFHQIPRRVLFQARTPVPSLLVCHRVKRVAYVHARNRLPSPSLIQEDDLCFATQSIIRVVALAEKDESPTLYLLGLKKLRSFSSHPPPGPPPCRG